MDTKIEQTAKAQAADDQKLWEQLQARKAALLQASTPVNREQRRLVSRGQHGSRARMPSLTKRMKGRIQREAWVLAGLARAAAEADRG